MPMTDAPLMVTVFHACKPDKHFGADGCVNGTAEVSERKPASGDWSLLFELHVPRSELITGGKKKDDLSIEWKTAEGWPMQASAL